MGKRLISTMVLVVLCLIGTGKAQDDAAVMKAWQDYMTPGKVHAYFASMVGTWDLTMKSYVPGNPEPIVAKGTAVMEMILGGRYLQSKFTGDMMGMVMEGMSLDVYDNALEEFTSTWVDNMGTGIVISKGKAGKDENKLELFGSMVDPISKTEKKIVTVSEHVSPDKIIQKIFYVEDGKRTISMEMEFTRKK